jgi:hypothetical protein
MEIVMIRNWATNVANQGIALIASLLMRSAIKPLLEVDERSLRAVGLSRADLIECLSTPYTADPTELLASRSRTRGRVETSQGSPARAQRRGRLATSSLSSRASFTHQI